MASSRRDGSYYRYPYVEKPKRDSDERDKEFGDILKKCADKFEDLVKHRVRKNYIQSVASKAVNRKIFRRGGVEGTFSFLSDFTFVFY